MFSLQPSDELVFGSPATCLGYQIREDLIVDPSFMENNVIKFSTGRKTNLGSSRQRTRETRHDSSTRRVTHRDVEKKRRQEMSNLYVSLQSLLPLDHIKGKRSISDQIQEAVNHIEQKQKSIQELRVRRDKLKKLSNLSGKKVASSDGSDVDLHNFVMANLVLDGIEILIKSSDLGLSRVLIQLLERELDVVSCVSTRTDQGRFLHKIHIEGRDLTSFHVVMLQDKLTKAINFLDVGKRLISEEIEAFKKALIMAGNPQQQIDKNKIRSFARLT